MLEEENPLVDYWKVEGGQCEDASVQWSDWEGMFRGIFSICTGMQEGSLISLVFPEGGQWGREEVQNREVIHTLLRMCAFHFVVNLRLERKMPGRCISVCNILEILCFK